ncbi:sensor histidine kinase [Dyadobacter psychrotolerans]|uniref:histidine kinase n=2 Tax=Dyadobacter psychrotolerans TaxID=2541721 RepID=A0A4R5DLS7_9BACT|nr:sensor histidine kinase [Dyadobacter psychrotolerans]TDE15206.1 sensor histidine kinase [Dyadobacter psychrotolerans]
MKRFNWFLTMILLLPLLVSAQLSRTAAGKLRNKAESLILLADQTGRSRPEKGIELLLQAKLLGKNLHDTRILAKCSILYSELIYRLYDLEKSTNSFLEAFETAQRSGDSLLMFSASGNMLLATLSKPNPYQKAQQEIIEHFLHGGRNDSIRGWARYQKGLIVHNNLNERANAAKYFQNSIQIANKLKDAKLLAMSKSALYNNSVRLAKRDSSDQLIFEAMDYFRKHGYIKELALAENYLADRYRFNANFAKAYEHYNKALALSEKIHDKITQGVTYTGLLQNSLAESNYSAMLPYIEKTEVIYKEINYSFGWALMQNFRGKYYAGLGNHRIASRYYALVDSLNRTIKSDLLALINFGAKMTRSIQTGETIKADSLLIRSLKMVNEMVPKSLQQEADRKNTQLQTLMGVSKEVRQVNSKIFLDSTFRKNFSKKNLITDLKTVRFAADSLNTSTGLPKSLDSIIAITNSNKLAELETRYGVKQKSDSLRIETQAHQITETKLEQRNKIIGLSIIFTAILLSFMYMLARSRHHLQTSNENLILSQQQLSASYEQIQKDQIIIERLYGEINHRVDNNFGVVRRFAEVAAEKMSDPDPMDQLRCRVYTFELLHEQLYKNDNKPGRVGMQYHLRSLCDLINQAYSVSENVQILIDADVDLEIHSALRTGIIVNELVTNSFKYAFNGAPKKQAFISITLTKQENSECLLTVKDNGPGFDISVKHSSYGFKLIKGTASEFDAKCKYTNEEGARFDMKFTDIPKPVKKIDLVENLS